MIASDFGRVGGPVCRIVETNFRGRLPSKSLREQGKKGAGAPHGEGPGQRCPPGCPRDELPAALRTDGTEAQRVATEAARADEGQQERSTQD